MVNGLKEEVKKLKSALTIAERKSNLLSERLAGSAPQTAQIDALKSQIQTLKSEILEGKNDVLKESKTSFDLGFQKAMDHFKTFKDLMKPD